MRGVQEDGRLPRGLLHGLGNAARHILTLWKAGGCAPLSGRSDGLIEDDLELREVKPPLPSSSMEPLKRHQLKAKPEVSGLTSSSLCVQYVPGIHFLSHPVVRTRLPFRILESLYHTLRLLYKPSRDIEKWELAGGFLYL